ncbi:hypothetical protein ACRN9C_03310 [Shewanella frigidimarina]|uniref:hypothetical protein n=1 Tax=Shewanella frigidimarina TaxID=56812 RepID=UPI003D7A7B04
MNFEQVKTATINSIQLFLDEQNFDLMVGELSDDDYKILCGGYGDLEWPWAIGSIGNDDHSVSFCFKITGGHIPEGIAMGLYDVESETLSIHMIESFVRDKPAHPLKGRMIYFTLVAAALFIRAFDGKLLNFVDPLNSDLEKLYISYGFSRSYSSRGMTIQTISIDGLLESIADFSESD